MNKTKKIKKYNFTKMTLEISSAVITFIYLGLLSFTSFSQSIIQIINNQKWNNYFNFLFFLFFTIILIETIKLPLNFYNSYLLEKKYNLSNQNLWQWIIETLKESTLSLFIVFPISLIFFFLINTLTNYWWLLFGGIIIVFSVLATFIAPILIFPIFYKFKKIEENELTDKIEEILTKQNVSFNGFYSFNLSKNTKKANAAFTGFGKSKRIILSDTLINNFSLPEILIVFAHELGHFQKKHIKKNLIISIITILSILGCSHFAYLKTIFVLNIQFAEITSLPILIFYLSILSFIILPLSNALSRKFEIAADKYAVSLTHDLDSFISCMQKLADLNYSDQRPNKIIEFLFFDHPSINKRIKYAKSYFLEE